jgi:hypothetical protein
MYQLNNKERRVGGLLLEALVLIFVFSSAWSQTEFEDYNSGDLVVKTSPIEQIAFCDSDSAIKSLLDVIAKVQMLGGNFSEFVVDVAGFELINTSCLYVAHSIYNSFYTHLTANAP